LQPNPENKKTMKKTLSLILFSAVMYSCSNQTEQQKATVENTSTEVKEPTFTKVWETDTVMTTAESTLYDKATKTIYVSNIAGHHSEKDGVGFISKLQPDGTVTALNWTKGLNAPKGMALLNGKLYVTDIDELVEINVSDGKIAKKHPVPGATFLNDAATDGKNVYFSDTQTGKVHVLENGKINTVAEGMNGINGLAFNDQGELFILDGQGLRKYNKSDKTSEFINEVVTGGDGLVIIDDNTYIASKWHGEIFLIRDGKEHLLLDTQAAGSNTADIDYIAEEGIVLVPTFMKNRVVAYKLDY